MSKFTLQKDILEGWLEVHIPNFQKGGRINIYVGFLENLIKHLLLAIDLESDLATNAHVLAIQTDAARAAEVEAGELRAENEKLRARVEELESINETVRAARDNFSARLTNAEAANQHGLERMSKLMDERDEAQVREVGLGESLKELLAIAEGIECSSCPFASNCPGESMGENDTGQCRWVFIANEALSTNAGKEFLKRLDEAEKYNAILLSDTKDYVEDVKRLRAQLATAQVGAARSREVIRDHINRCPECHGKGRVDFCGKREPCGRGCLPIIKAIATDVGKEVLEERDKYRRKASERGELLTASIKGCDNLRAQLATSQVGAAAMREALEWYGDGDNYEIGAPGKNVLLDEGAELTVFQWDCGEIAIKALATDVGKEVLEELESWRESGNLSDMEIQDLHSQLATAQAECERKKVVLKRLEWMKSTAHIGHIWHYEICPWCGQIKNNGHDADCEIAKALAPTDPQGKIPEDHFLWPDGIAPPDPEVEEKKCPCPEIDKVPPGETCWCTPEVENFKGEYPGLKFETVPNDLMAAVDELVETWDGGVNVNILGDRINNKLRKTLDRLAELVGIKE